MMKMECISQGSVEWQITTACGAGTTELVLYPPQQPSSAAPDGRSHVVDPLEVWSSSCASNKAQGCSDAFGGMSLPRLLSSILPVDVFSCSSTLRVIVILFVTLQLSSSSSRPSSRGRVVMQHELPTAYANLLCRRKPASPVYAAAHGEGFCEGPLPEESLGRATLPQSPEIS